MNNQYLSKITIENYFSIEKIELSGLDKSKEIYFLGENGDGKTLVCLGGNCPTLSLSRSGTGN